MAMAAPDDVFGAVLQLHEINASAMPVVKPLLIDLMLDVLMLPGRYAQSRPANGDQSSLLSAALRAANRAADGCRTSSSAEQQPSPTA
jgi:hypothetical protein